MPEIDTEALNINEKGQLESQGTKTQSKPAKPSSNKKGYTIEYVKVPNNIKTGESFDIEVEVCCNQPSDVLSCKEAKYTLTLYRGVQGPAGIWPFFAVNTISKQVTGKTLVSEKFRLLAHAGTVPGCVGADGFLFPGAKVSVSKPGPWAATASIANASQTTYFTVQP